MKIPYRWLKDYIDTNLDPQAVADKLTLIGHALDKPIYQNGGDTIIDLEDRGNRADAVGIIGIARELAALTRNKTNYPSESNLPKINNVLFSPKIKILSEKVIRWMAVVFKNIKIEPSPLEIKKKLKSYGIEPINNVVDITNYIMIETGMPLHAFDLKNINEIIIRNAKKGEKLITFEGTELDLNDEDLVAADSKYPLTLTTAIGGKSSGINNSTRDILIEAGIYHQPTARRSALKHNIKNETSLRLGKYLHPEYCELAIKRTLYLLKTIANKDPEPIIFDHYPKKCKHLLISLTEKRLKLLSGQDIKIPEAATILKNLEFKLKQKGNNEIAVTVPYFRTDITIEDDLIEEVLRIRGYEKITPFLTERPSPPKLIFPELNLENRIKDIMIRIGYNEVISLQIVDIKESQKTEIVDESKVIRLQNSWNEELNVLRPEFISPQLKYIYSYINHAIVPISIFEIGKTYLKEEGNGYESYKEIRKLVFSTDRDFYSLKADLLRLLKELGVEDVSFEKIFFPAFKLGASSKIIIRGTEVGKIGSIRRKILDSFSIYKDINHCVIHVSKLLDHIKKEVPLKVETSIKNYIKEDFSFVVNNDVNAGMINSEILKYLKEGDVLMFIGEYSSNKLRSIGKKSVTFRVKLLSENHLDIRDVVEKIKLFQETISS